MTMNPQAIKALHDLYCQQTGLDLPYRELEHGGAWVDWASHGWTARDLIRVIAYLKHCYPKAPDILSSMLRFRHLIRMTDYFGEYLAEANARARVKPVDRGRASALQATGRPPPEKTAMESQPARNPDQIMRGIEQLKNFKKEMGWE